jgi:hypothetical protein
LWAEDGSGGGGGLKAGAGRLLRRLTRAGYPCLFVSPHGRELRASLVFELGQFTGNISKFQRFIDAGISCIYMY